MSGKRVLVTGAAGFVGSHTVDLLVDRGYEVTALDVLDAQVHGAERALPRYLEPHGRAIRFVAGDVRDRALWAELLGQADAVIHLAAAVGVGQSMYRPKHYADVNIGGTAALLDVLANQPHTIQKIVVASSMSIYGEGAYLCAACGPVHPTARAEARLAAHEWEHLCPRCGKSTTAVPTPETKPLGCTSIYAISKKVQEEMVLLFGKAYRIPVVALRYFNIYGPRQSLSNPYTGVAAIFLSRLLNGHAPHVFEDGLQSRDFVHVRDVARANVLALEASGAVEVCNVGTGRALSVLEIARILSDGLGLKITASVTQKFRAGDVRHCYADCTRIREQLGFTAEMTPEQGFPELIEWSRNERPQDDFAKTLEELASRRLVQ